MDYLNVLIPDLRRPPFIGTDMKERGVWLMVMGYCCHMENGGRIEGAAQWSNDEIRDAIGVSMEQVKKCTRLVMIDGQDIVAHCYPSKSQRALEQKRKAAIATNAKRWGSESVSESHSDSLSESERERERERETPPTPNGGLSEGELRFVELHRKLSETGKFPGAFTPLALAEDWHKKARQVDPTDPVLIADLVHDAMQLASPKIGFWPRWMDEAVLRSRKSENAKSGAPVSLGPPAGAM